MMRTRTPLLDFIERQGRFILDGGLATALEQHGHCLDDPLWSARLLIEGSDAIHRVHMDYLEAGADCITTSSYQASIEGFLRRGLTVGKARDLLMLSTDLAVRARDSFWNDPANHVERLRPLVAASVGPYGAFLADGSEYTGNYPVSDDVLYEFHRERWRVLSQSPADVLACETLPSLREARVLLKLLEATPGRTAWFSFSCRDGMHLCDGTPFVEAVQLCDSASASGVAAVGVNCTAPRFIPALVEQATRTTDLPVVVYPNSGEIYDASTKRWTPGGPVSTWLEEAAHWSALGAAGIGGCCRIGASTIAALRTRLSVKPMDLTCAADAGGEKPPTLRDRRSPERD